MLYMFDMDGTLIEGFIRNWKEQGLERQPKHHTEIEAELYDRVEVLPKRCGTIWHICNSDRHAQFAIVTNQGGVAFGYQTKEQVGVKIGLTCAKLAFFFGRPFSVHVCFTHPKGTIEEYRKEDERRKPGTGMLYEALERHGIKRCSNAVYVGDMESDAEAAVRANILYQHADDFFA